MWSFATVDAPPPVTLPVEPVNENEGNENQPSEGLEESSQAPQIPKSESIAIFIEPFRAATELLNNNEEYISIRIPVTATTEKSPLVYYFDDLYQTWIALPTVRNGDILTAEAPVDSWITALSHTDVTQPTDILESWASREIMKLTSLQIFNGFGDGSFKPQEITSRYQIAVTLSKAMGLIPTDDTTEVLGSSSETLRETAPEWAKPYVELMLSTGIMKGTENSFEGAQGITRAEMATILGRVLQNVGDLGHESSNAITFQDAALFPEWAVSGIGAAMEAGIIKGYPDGSFNPQTTLTRAEMATIVSRLMDYLKERA
jgi:hypothetical protein